MEILHNGIVLPRAWPPANVNPESTEPVAVPYLAHPPAVIPVDVGRQLFVDDFLIQTTTMTRTFHSARKYDGNPVLRPETPLEASTKGVLPTACPKSGGVWYDPANKLFKMWYEAGWINSLAYAISEDGIRWQRPDLDICPGTNRIVPEFRPDSTTVFIDHDTPDPAQRFKLFVREDDGRCDRRGNCMVSPDGIHWSEPVKTNPLGDRSTFFYNPFRKKFVYSIRAYNAAPGRGRVRYYRECDDFLGGAQWSSEQAVFWTGADRLDQPDPEIGMTPQLYNLDAVAYESLMLGIFEIHLGPENNVCARGGFPKITELMTAFSRDGFHWHRPDRRAFIPAARQPDAWDRGYVQPAGGICLVMGDELWFYYIGFRGDKARLEGGLNNGMYANASTGIAKLRRDGFASMEAGAMERNLCTRPVTFKGKRLFVNVEASGGELTAAITDVNFRPIAPFTSANCIPVRADSTRHEVRWQGADDLAAASNRPVCICFNLKRGKLYSFWVSQDHSGKSGGYVAAGGPGFACGKDG
jgi:hypothetical protein